MPGWNGVRRKILTFAELAEESRRLRGQGKRLVATNGCFDLLHAGHVRYLSQARRFGEALAALFQLPLTGPT